MPRAVADNRSWIGWAFFADLANALSLTLGYMFSRPVEVIPGPSPGSSRSTSRRVS